MEPLSGRNTAYTIGAITGLGVIAYTLILYLINLELVLGFWFFLGYAIVVAGMIFAVAKQRSEQANYIGFSDALKLSFIVGALAVLLWIVFNFILFKYIDQQLVILSKEKAIERAMQLMEWAKASSDEVEKVVEEAEKQSYEPTIGTTALNFAFSCFVGFLFSLVIGGFFSLISKPFKPQEIQ